MEFYLSYSKLCMKRVMVYRLNSIFKMLSRFIFLAVQIIVWKAVYSGDLTYIDSQFGRIDLNQMIVYTIYSHMMYCFISNGTIASVNEKIRTGDIVFCLSKPYSFLGYQCTEALSTSFINLLLEGMPLLILASLIYQIPHLGIMPVLLFTISSFLGWCLFFLMSMLCAGLSFWVVQTGPLNFLLDGMIKLFSGNTIPLWFFPDAFLSVITMLPFSCIYFVPLTFLTTKVDLEHTCIYFGKQLIWIVIIYLLTKLLLSKGEKKMMAQGG